jgi:hypothetical protein
MVRMLAAIAAVTDAVAAKRQRDLVVAEQASREKMLESFRARVSSRLLPVEPFHQRWNVFRLFDLEHDETRWTQWFAAILREENGARCARVAWRAVCEAIAKRALRQPPIGDVADAAHWRGRAS